MSEDVLGPERVTIYYCPECKAEITNDPSRPEDMNWCPACGWEDDEA